MSYGDLTRGGGRFVIAITTYYKRMTFDDLTMGGGRFGIAFTTYYKRMSYDDLTMGGGQICNSIYHILGKKKKSTSLPQEM